MNQLKRRAPREHAKDERLTDAGHWIVEEADYTEEELKIQKGERG